MLADPRTGLLREAKVVTGVDDHSRFCVIATVVERATGRAVCLALASACQGSSSRIRAAPHRGCRRRISVTATRSDAWRGLDRGRWDRSAKPATPSAR